MRTTVSIDDGLLRQAKSLAAQDGRSLGSVVEDGLRVLLAEYDQANDAASPPPLPTADLGGLQPGVDLEDKEALAALLDGDRAR